MTNYLTLLVVTLLACFGGQLAALKASGGRTLKSESNYFSSLGRIQAAAQGDPEILMTGSSLTGRLPDRAQGFAGLANLGCDGGCALDALRAIDRGALPLGRVVVIETNTLQRALHPAPSEVGMAMTRWWFKVGLRVPVLSAYARPAAFLYSPLLERRIGKLEGDGDLGLASRPVRVPFPAETWGPAEQRLIDDVIGIVNRLQQRGARVVFVSLPPSRGPGVPPPPWVVAMIAGSEAEWWDIGNQADPALIKLTDGRHMAAESAARTARTLLSELQ